MPVDDKSGQTSANCGLETGISEIWAHNESPILDRLLAILTTGQPSWVGVTFS
jgi:hypothetical protein